MITTRDLTKRYGRTLAVDGVDLAVREARRLAELDPWDTPNSKAGLHPTCALLLAERKVAALGSDGNSDTAPSTTEGVDFPIHALALNAMGERFRSLIDVTIAYPHGRPTFWEFLCGQTPVVRVKLRELPIPAAFCDGDYAENPAFRVEFQHWLDGLWAEKDRQLGQMLQG